MRITATVTENLTKKQSLILADACGMKEEAQLQALWHICAQMAEFNEQLRGLRQEMTKAALLSKLTLLSKLPF